MSLLFKDFKMESLEKSLRIAFMLTLLFVQQSNPLPSTSVYKSENEIRIFLKTSSSEAPAQASEVHSNSDPARLTPTSPTVNLSTVLARSSHLSSKNITSTKIISPTDTNLNKGQASNHQTEYSNLVLKLDRPYSPYEIAEYVYTTGDEKGISQILYDMVQDGQIMSNRDDLISFLEAVQKILGEMRRNPFPLENKKHFLHSGSSESSRFSSYRSNPSQNGRILAR